MPVVANGKVYVASNKLLTIFGLGGHGRVASARPPWPGRWRAVPKVAASSDEDLQPAAGTGLALRTRAGTIARVDNSEALRRERTGVLVPGKGLHGAGKL